MSINDKLGSMRPKILIVRPAKEWMKQMFEVTYSTTRYIMQVSKALKIARV